MTDGDDMKSLIEDLARALVDEADQVQVTEITGATTTVFELRVAKTDVGKIIGKSGRTLKAFRAIVTAVATKLHRKAILEVIE